MLVETILFKQAFVLLQNAKNLNPKLNNAIDIIVEATQNGRYIVVLGAGKCSTIALKATETMCSLGIPSFHLDAFLSCHGDLGRIMKDQIVISLSKSGNTQEVVQALDGCGKKGAKLISISCKDNSLTGKMAEKYEGLDIVLQCGEEACHMGLAPTTSTTLFSAIMDALSVVSSYRIGITKEKFLENHISGSLGDQIRKELNSEDE
jgi:arabinose-5-phosphate isomerase